MFCFVRIDLYIKLGMCPEKEFLNLGIETFGEKWEGGASLSICWPVKHINGAVIGSSFEPHLLVCIFHFIGIL